LQDQKVGILRLEEVDDRGKLEATFDVPVDDREVHGCVAGNRISYVRTIDEKSAL